MSLERLLKKAALAVAIPFTLFTASNSVADRHSIVRNNYRVDAEELHVGPITLSDIANFAEASFTVDESGSDYAITGNMRGLHYMYHSRMNFRVTGSKVDGNYMPSHYEMDFINDSWLSSDGASTTIIDFNYDTDRAFSYSYKVKDGVTTSLHDNRPNGVEIDDSVKDMISAIMDLRHSDLNSSQQIHTLISGRRRTYNARFQGIESIDMHGADMPCAKYRITIPAGIIDSNSYRFTFWIGSGNSRTPLKMNIRPGNNSLLALHTGTIRE